jgi:uncharacterized protein YecE (DUF72 family)
MPLHLGCPLWGQKSWVGGFLPTGTKPRDMLAAYSRRVNAVEGNTTFYAVPEAATVERWRDGTPPGFAFCLKVPQAISHHKRLRGCEAETAEFVDRLQRLGDRRGPAFLQLPPSFGQAQLPVLDAYLAAWPRELRLAVEPRHADFFGPAEADFDALLRRHGVARCAFDTVALFSAPAGASAEVSEAQSKKPKYPRRLTRTGPFGFVRYVCHPELEANHAWLAEWADAVAHWLRANDDVFFFVHHPDDTYAPDGIRLFHAMVAERAAIPALPAWGAAAPSQPTLGL